MNDGVFTQGAGEAPLPDAAPETTRRGALALGLGLLGAGLIGAAPGLAAPGPAQAGAVALPVAPRATQVVISKSNRVLELRRGQELLGRYRIDLGFAPKGHKLASGDGRTPEGRYVIDRRNPRSEFHLSLGISYPNAMDVARARAAGVDPGGDIFIHGEPVRAGVRTRRRDWTAGCIAVTNREIEQIWALTPLGVPVIIFA